MGGNESARVGGLAHHRGETRRTSFVSDPFGGKSQTSTPPSLLLSFTKKYVCL